MFKVKCCQAQGTQNQKSSIPIVIMATSHCDWFGHEFFFSINIKRNTT